MSSSSSSSSSLPPWSCKKCTFLNSPSQKSHCQICLTPSSPSSSSSCLDLKWACKACTFLNPYRNTNCEVCDTRASVSSLSRFDDLYDTGPEGDVDSSVGSVFLPLRRCKRKGMETETEMEMDPVRDDGDLVDLSGFRGVMASNKEDTVKENNSSGAGLVTLKVLSYNVWFREDLEMYKRMKAIGELIQLHSPEIICFQEVTPNIYEAFCQSSWWKAYRCSVSNGMADSRPYFCMLLSKIPVKSFTSKPFRNSIMGRELIIAELEVKGDISLVVATSHLESPCPSPPKWDQMFSKERVEQANETVKFLNKNPNVIFGGDLNWDDKLDGQFPLSDKWIDAWTELRPGEDGFTYDTKSNMMLSGNRTLRKRLDRFMCSLQDFKISGVQMIGMEPIPGLTYCKEKKIKNEVKKLELPVLPSDHYGLLLTFSSI
ncbi:uncharacterized protein LOC110808032 [Carica papaya]|uniref:uncharacterized protein LOC110808032 n=1 Tax=Carica papaya TaxID=3649 RepID=UPI000B8D028E|nr:uncharacterized protein LOC110808032 [Carica papaya]XP_021889050.1 uncharacterized protein LOC110808032 [Carica papaya]XP_021889051.1 uncharacterized protein LOC110808032 [Carica papaya]XP_021889052.1 uncharacterized protein LOC110808032 [Carica papaya]XP_021889053.1 uncharacterized protein LOC110808032 [Carica papaya]XP_021889054.1 uncharacterized protein LOC110808032 [Carica papaya]XP_021889055.1 uncharacterized protein LOC110808032 [Carica papaya]XP_021889056.1 uncharacterized protein 